MNVSDCRQCFHRRRCRAFTLRVEPEFPFVFKPGGKYDSIFDVQNGIKNTLDSLFPGEAALLEKRALEMLPESRGKGRTIVRLKMYELLHLNGE